MAKRKKLPGQLKPRKKRGSTTLLGRIAIVLLSILLGMAIVIGAEAAIFYGLFGWATLNRAEQYAGIELGSALLTDDSVLRDLTVLGMLSEFSKISGRLSELTLESLFNEYGILLPSSISELVPDTVMKEILLSELIGPNAPHAILSHVTLGELLNLAGDGIIPAAAYDKIKDRPASLILEGDLGAIFEGVYAGDLLGIAVEENGEGGVDPVPGEDGELHLMSYIATLDIGEYLSAEDRNAVLQKTLDHTPIEVLIEGQEDNLIVKALGGKTLGDIMKMENGGFYFDTDALIADLYLGDALGYTKDEDGNFYDDAGNPPSALLSKLVGITVLELPNSDVMGIIDGMYVYELMDFTKRQKLDGNGDPILDENDEPVYEYVKLDENGEVADTMEGLVSEFAVLKVGDLRDDDTLNAQIQGIKLGDAMGYTYDEEKDVWTKDGDPATGVMRPLLGATIANVDSRLDKLYLGEIMGFDNVETDPDKPPVFMKDVDGDGEYDDDNSVPDSLMSYFVDMQLKSIDEEGAFNDRIKTVKVGDVMGYTYIESEDKWYSVYDEENPSNNKLATGVTAALAGSTVNGMDDAVKTVKVGDVMGYTYIEGEGWYSEHTSAGGVKDTLASGLYAALADKKVDEMDSAIKTVKVGDVMGYTYIEGEGWYSEHVSTGGDTNTLATGVTAALAGYKVDEMDEAVKTVKIGDVMGYTRVEETVGEGEEAVTVEKWYTVYDKEDPSNNKLATGIYGALAGYKINEMEDAVKTVKVGDAVGYQKVGDTWYTEYHGEGSSQNKVATGVTAALSDFKVNELDGAVKTVKIGDVMGYTRVEETVEIGGESVTVEKWYTVYDATDSSNNKLATGIYGALAGYTVDEMDEAVKTVKIGDAMGYQKVGDTWYSTYVGAGDTGNVKAKGIYAAIADYKVDEMDEAVKTVKVGEAMGYEKVGDTWYSTYSEDGNSGNDVKVTNTVLLAVIDNTVGNMDTALDDMTLAKALGYKKQEPDDGYWYEADGVTKVTNTFTIAMADTKVSELSTKMNTLQFGEAMGYEKVGNTWYSTYSNDGNSENDVKVTNTFVLSMADKNLSEMSTAMDSLTLGEAMGYKKNSVTGKWEDEGGNPPTGYVSLLDPDTQMSNLNSSIANLDKKTMGELNTHGILDLDDSQKSGLNTLLELKGSEKTWDQLTFAEFIDTIVPKEES